MKPWVVVLGASSGFGAATARVFARNGHPVFGVHMDRRGGMPAVEALIAELRAHDVPVVFHNGNAADDDNRAFALGKLAEAMGDGHVGVLLHSIAFGTLRPFFSEEAPLARRQLEMTLDVMASSLVYWTQDLVARNWLRHGSRVYAMTSSGSIASFPSYGAVSAAKCALESYCRQIAVELAPKGITANAIMAGVTRTAAFEKIPGSDRLATLALARNPHGRLTTVQDVAECVYALSGPATQWMTGNTLRIDGGETIAG